MRPIGAAEECEACGFFGGGMVDGQWSGVSVEKLQQDVGCKVLQVAEWIVGNTGVEEAQSKVVKWNVQQDQQIWRPALASDLVDVSGPFGGADERCTCQL